MTFEVPPLEEVDANEAKRIVEVLEVREALTPAGATRYAAWPVGPPGREMRGVYWIYAT